MDRGHLRLAAGELIGGAPAVNITGIGFNASDLQRLIDHHRGEVGKRQQQATRKPVKSPMEVQVAPSPVVAFQRRSPDPSAIPVGAILATIKQTQAALGLGRTKVNELMNDGRLVRREIDGGVRIEVGSIHALAGTAL